MEKSVTTTYIEMTHPGHFNPHPDFETKIQVKEINNDPFINFMLFAGVGLPYRWSSRFRFSIDKWNSYFLENDLRTFIGFHENRMIGFFELIVDGDNTEIIFFGMFPEHTGKGLGSCFLSHAIRQSWQTGAKRIWLHTCTNDNKYALPNYLARGFRIFDQKTAIENVPDHSELIRLVSEFFRGYLDRYSTRAE